jgi:hypothetical protein
LMRSIVVSIAPTVPSYPRADTPRQYEPSG